MGHRRDRKGFRTRHDVVVHRPGDPRDTSHRAQSADPRRAVPHLRAGVRRRAPVHGLHRHGCHRADDHRGRGALRRHGSLRGPAHPDRVVRTRVPRARAELLRPRGDDPGQPRHDQEPVLQPSAVLGDPAPGGPRNAGDRHRVPGGDLRRVLGIAPGRPARAVPAPVGQTHLAGGGRPDLPAGRQLDPVLRRPAPDRGLPELQPACHRLRLGRHRNTHADEHAVPAPGSDGVALGGVETRRVRRHHRGPGVTFFAANLTKIVSGGWLPLTIAAVIVTLITTWRTGADILTQRRRELEGPLDDFAAMIRETGVPRVPGLAVFLHSNRTTTPLALSSHVSFNSVLHEHVVIIQIVNENVPHIRHVDRVSVDSLDHADDGIVHITVHVGFNDSQDIPKGLALALGTSPELEVNAEDAYYFLSVLTLSARGTTRARDWRLRLFVWMAHNAANRTEVFHLPPELTIVMGAHLDL